MKRGVGKTTNSSNRHNQTEILPRRPFSDVNCAVDPTDCSDDGMLRDGAMSAGPWILPRMVAQLPASPSWSPIDARYFFLRFLGAGRSPLRGLFQLDRKLGPRTGPAL